MGIDGDSTPDGGIGIAPAAFPYWGEGGYYSGGGAGSGRTTPHGSGGLGGGADGVNVSNNGLPGDPNTGGGGSGYASTSPTKSGGNGGSGIVVVRVAKSTGGTGSYSADAILRSTPFDQFTANAVLKKTAAGSFTEGAVLRRTQSSSFTQNAVLKRAQSGSFSANAITRRTQPGIGDMTGLLDGQSLLGIVLSLRGSTTSVGYQATIHASGSDVVLDVWRQDENNEASLLLDETTLYASQSVDQRWLLRMVSGASRLA